MINRIDQKALFDNIVNSISINTKPDENGSIVPIPVHVYWGSEPVQHELPAIIVKLITMNNPIDRAMGNIWGEDLDGVIEFGFMGEDTILIKVKAVDVINQIGNIPKQDIGQYIMGKIYDNILYKWDQVMKESAISDNISPISDVSSILENEMLYELQLTVGIKNLVKRTPVETGILLHTAPFIQKAQAYIGILPNNNTIIIG